MGEGGDSADTWAAQDVSAGGDAGAADELTADTPAGELADGASCPTAVIQVLEGHEVTPQTALHLVGSQSLAAGGAPAQYEWTVEQPSGSRSVFLPSAEGAGPTFETNVAGTYVFHLEV